MKVIYRFSDKGYPKNKLPLVNNENCFRNFCSNFLENNLTNLILIEDNCEQSTSEKFNVIIKQVNIGDCPVVLRTNVGNAGSFNYALDIATREFSDNEVVYFPEGDFIHAPHSRKILEEGYDLLGAQVDYVTLYAHPDKEMPENIKEEYIFRSASTYWRSCISTVMTCSAKVKTLKNDYNIIKKWTTGPHPKDHEMFSELRANGRLLISPMPGYSTHGESDWLSPFRDWNNILEKSI